jgi:hypothetical protein
MKSPAQINTEIARLLGLPAANMRSANIQLLPGELPLVTIRTIIPGLPEWEDKTEQYHLTPLDEPRVAEPPAFDIDAACAQALQRVQSWVALQTLEPTTIAVNLGGPSDTKIRITAQADDLTREIIRINQQLRRELQNALFLRPSSKMLFHP